jgi:hypothetical protein
MHEPAIVRGDQKGKPVFLGPIVRNYIVMHIYIFKTKILINYCFELRGVKGCPETSN